MSSAGRAPGGRRSTQGGQGAHIGSVTHAVIHHASCPAAVVPHA
ncbi:universal stress protein [Streptomyces sp. NPDC050848]